MLPHFDADRVGWLMERFAGLGIDVRTGAVVKGEEKAADGFLVHAAGRAPDLGALDPATAGVRLDHERLAPSEFLQSVPNPRVFAARDAAGSGQPLTSVSRHDAEVVAANLLEGNRRRPDYRGVPSVAFVLPPIAAVGLGEAAVRAKGLRFRVKTEKASGWYTARRLAEPVYGFKVLIEEGTDRILGANLVAPQAEKVINLFALAIRHGLAAADVRATMFAYPTSASDIAYIL